MGIISDVIENTRAIIKGMMTTASYIPREKWTVQYPDEPVTLQPRFRGQHLLHVDELGREKCVACYLCAAACPSDCIYIVAADDPRPPKERIGVDERFAQVYNIARPLHLRGFCVSLSKDAITHASLRAVGLPTAQQPAKTKDDLLITKRCSLPTTASPRD